MPKASSPDWSALLSAALQTPVSGVSVSRIQSLWAGYGSVSRLSFQQGRLVAKQVCLSLPVDGFRTGG